MDKIILENDIQNFDKPLIKNYIIFSLMLFVFLLAYIFPDAASYVENYGTYVRQSPIVFKDLIEILRMFSLFSPGIILIFLVKRYLSTKESKIIFLKIPSIILFVAFSVDFFAGLFSSCLGEDCFGSFIFFVIFPCIWFLVSLLFSFLIYIINKKENVRKKILKFTQMYPAKNFLLYLFIFSLICLTLKVSFYFIMSSESRSSPGLTELINT